MKIIDLFEGGAALKKVSPISQVEAREVIPKIIAHVASTLKISKLRIKLLGSAGKKKDPTATSGDIDLAVQATADELEHHLPDLSYDGKNHRVMKGIGVYSFAYDLGSKLVQVDLMPVKNVQFAEWASQAHVDDLNAGLKGAHRNELFFAVAKYANLQIIKRDEENAPLVIKRYIYDLHKGLFEATQTREGKKKSNKNFKTVDRTLISDDPVEITELLFGKHVTPEQVSTFKGTLAAINSPRFPYKKERAEILKLAKTGISGKNLEVPSYLS